MPYDEVARSVAKAGETPAAPSDGDINSINIEDMGGDPQGYLIQWKNLDEGWFYAEQPDSYVSLDSNI